MDFQTKLKNFLQGITQPVQQEIQQAPQQLQGFGQGLLHQLQNLSQPTAPVPGTGQPLQQLLPQWQQAPMVKFPWMSQPASVQQTVDFLNPTKEGELASWGAANVMPMIMSGSPEAAASMIPDTLNLVKPVLRLAPRTVGKVVQELSPYQQGFEAGFAKIPGKVQVEVGPNTTDYLSQLKQQQQTASSVDKGTLLTRGQSFLADVKRKLIDSTAPIEDVLSQAQKDNGYEVLPSRNVSFQIDRAIRSNELAGQFLKDNGMVDVIRNVPDVHTLDQYLIARHAPEVEAAGFKTGRNTAADAQLVQDLAPTYEPYAQQVVQYGQKLLDYAVQTGLVSKETAAALKAKYPNYIPLNRIFNELEQSTPRGTGKGVASLSKQTVVQGLKGSERAIQNPTESLLTKTLDAFSQGERNQAAQMLASYKDLPGNPFNITPLRTAENVTKRIDLYSQAADLKPVQNLLGRLLQTRQRWARQLESQINNLNKQGLYQSLKQKFTENPVIQSSVDQSTFKPGGLTTTDTGDRFFVQTGKDQIKLKQNYAIPTKSQFKDIINNLVNLPSSEIQAIKSKIATRENNLAPIMDEIANISDSLNAVKAIRGNLFDEASLLKDAQSKGLSTFSTLNNGIKEIYQTTPEIASAAKFLDKRQLGFVGQIFATPVRLARLGITGINIPFIASNLAKDQVSAFINSDHALATSIANPQVFGKSLWTAVGHGAEYDNWIRNAGGGTSFDISRSAPGVSIGQIRAGRNVQSQIAYTVTHPGQLLRTVENAVNRGEETTRLQQFIGTRDALLKEGRTPQDADILGAKASRVNTVDFARSGDWGKALNSVFLYLNAGIQGSRTLMRNLQTRPTQTAAKIALTVYTPLATVTAWNLMNPQRKAAYDDIRDFEKDNNLIIIPPNPTKDPKTGKWNVIKIPFSQEIANLTIPIRKSIEGMQGEPGPTFGDFVSSILGTTTSLNTQSPNALVGQFVPQAVKPPLESILNKNLFTGGDIVPQYINGQPSKDLPPEMQVYDNTSGTARKIGKVLNTSPLKVGQFVKSTTGGVGSQFLNASDRALATVGVIPPEQIGGQSITQGLTQRFAQASGGQQLSNLFNNGVISTVPNMAESTLGGPNYDINGNPTSGNTPTSGITPVSPDVSKRIVENNGKFYASLGKNNVKSFDTRREAEIAVQKADFAKSDQNFLDLGDTILRKSVNGTVTTMNKNDFNTQLNTTLMTSAKDSQDFETWTKIATQQLQVYQDQLKDPSVDSLDKLVIQNKINALTKDLATYNSYGGFKKPRKPSLKGITFKKLSTRKTISYKAPKLTVYKGKKAPKPALKSLVLKNPIKAKVPQYKA